MIVIVVQADPKRQEKRNKRSESRICRGEIHETSLKILIILPILKRVIRAVP